MYMLFYINKNNRNCSVEMSRLAKSICFNKLHDFKTNCLPRNLVVNGSLYPFILSLVRYSTTIDEGTNNTDGTYFRRKVPYFNNEFVFQDALCLIIAKSKFSQ